jgi:hypothetical protein
MASPLADRQLSSRARPLTALAKDKQLLTQAIWRYARIEEKWTLPAELVG